jgi:hypothetical protein
MINERIEAKNEMEVVMLRTISSARPLLRK